MKKKIYILSLILGFIIISIFLLLIKTKDIQTNVRIDLCENITSGKLKVVCYAIFLKNHTFCNLAGDFSQYCYDSVFPLIDLDETICEGLDDNYGRMSCFTSLAVENRNVTICELLKEPAVIDVCYTNLFDYLDYFKSPEICRKIPHESTRFACLAKVTNNMTSCYDIVQEVEERGVCLGMLTKNISYCTIEAPDVLSRITIYSCIKDIAIELKNITLCDSMDYEEAKWSCKAFLAKNIEVCNETQGPWKDFCKIEYIKNNLT